MKIYQRKTTFLILCGLIGVMLLSACTGGNTVESVSNTTWTATQISTDENEPGVQDTENNDVLSEYAKSKTTDPDYAIVFPQDKVNEITITISEENWAAMMADMEENYGEAGSNNQNMPGAVPPDGPAAPSDRQNLALGAGAAGMGNTGDDDSNPIWVTATIQFGDDTWEYVGMRFKGNSSLKSSWSSGSFKLPFKLDFDEFESEYPEIENQRFYGFKQLSFSSNFSDSSYLREKVTADIFRDAGVPSAQTTFYAVYLDNGSTIEYMGLYTAVEVIDDTVIETQFTDDSGNVYKPDGRCATLAAGTYDEACYDKETNQDEADYTDLTAMVEILNSDLRLSDSATWRAELENILNVNEFINYLAVNTLVQNWDTYGVMTHNYYLYTDPESGQVNWIPWDNNMSLQSSPGGNGGAAPAGRNGGAANPQRPGGQGQSAPSISLDEIGENWPMIRNLLDDEVYAQDYALAVENVITTVFTLEKMSAVYDNYADLIKAYVSEETSDAGISRFTDAITTLKQHAAERVTLANEYLTGLD